MKIYSKAELKALSPAELNAVIKSFGAKLAYPNTPALATQAREEMLKAVAIQQGK